MYRPVDQRGHSDSYHGSYQNGEEPGKLPKPEHTRHGSYISPKGYHRSRRLRSWLCFWLSILIGLLWIGPSVVLLYFNFSNWTIGAAAWCPRGECSVIAYDPRGMTTAQKISRNDEWNHNLLGALQFAAKAHEVWFVFIAGSFLYSIIAIAAKSRTGFPIGYLMQHVEFSDLRNIVNPVLWTAPQNAPGGTSTGRPTRRVQLYIFALFSAFMCILANLMGPSAAILILPTLQWRDIDPVPARQFDKFLADTQPTGKDVLRGCSASELQNRNYTCTDKLYGAALDAWVEASIARTAQAEFSKLGIANSQSPTAPEDLLTFRLNLTETKDHTDFISWAPNRQTVRDLSNDYIDFLYMSAGVFVESPLAPFNNSLSLILQRRGPVVSFQSFASEGNVTTTVIDTDRQVRCYTPLLDTSLPTSCFRVGKGWNSTNTQSRFTIGNAEMEYPVAIESYSSDKAVYFASPFVPGKDRAACLVNGTIPNDQNCDWDKIFSQPVPPLVGSNNTQSNFIVEASIVGGYEGTVFYSQFIPSLGFATYSCDVSETSTTLGAVGIDTYPESTTPIVISADWILATWSVINNGDIPMNRTSATTVRSNVFDLLDSVYAKVHDNKTIDLTSSPTSPAILWIAMSQVIFGQALSMINYSVRDLPPDPTSQGAMNDPIHPVLFTAVRRQAWGYGLDSRTHRLGVAVFCAGILCVLARTILMIATRHRERSPVDLFCAAVDHTSPGLFDGMNNDEIKMARVRVRMFEDENDKIVFEDH